MDMEEQELSASKFKHLAAQALLSTPIEIDLNRSRFRWHAVITVGPYYIASISAFSKKRLFNMIDGTVKEFFSTLDAI